MAGHQLVLPYGYRDAKLAVIILSMIGEVVQGGLFFGWNALAIMIKDLGNFSNGCPADTDALCKSQESRLAVFWTVGIFALNCGPVLVGFVLDYCGPKLTTILGVLLNMLGLILFGVSQSSGPNAFVPASIFLGLGGIAFHLGQVHATALYPRKRGMLTAVFVAGFTGSGIVFYLLLVIFRAADSTRAAYMGVLMGYAGLCALWIPLVVWVMPSEPFRVGQMCLLTEKWRFVVRQRSDFEITYRRTTSLQDFVAAGAGGMAGILGGGARLSGAAAVPPTSFGGAGDPTATTGGNAVPAHAGSLNGNKAHASPAPSSLPSEVELAHAGRRAAAAPAQPPAGVHSSLLTRATPDSTDPFWLDDNEGARGLPGTGLGAALPQQQQQLPPQEASAQDGLQTVGLNAADPVGLNKADPGPPPQPSSPGAGVDPSRAHAAAPLAVPGDAALDPEQNPPSLPNGVVWGPLVFEARRFVEMRKLTFYEQFKSAESFGMGVFYTLNVFTMQFYLGTMRLQLQNKGSNYEAYSNFGNVIVAFAFLLIPVIGWLLDKKGYGVTLGTILSLSVITLCLQAIPSLPLQAITITVWMTARFFMYASYFAIFGALFGFRNFGRLVAVDNLFNGLFGLLQYPLTYLAIHPLNGDFMWVNLGQAACLLPLMWFCVAMYRWEREDLVPIRPMEGEELPCDMLGPQSRKKLKDLHLPSLHLPDAFRKLTRTTSDGQ